MIDSRAVGDVARQMSADREHFFGAQMDEWAQSVFKIITQNLASGPLSAPKSELMHPTDKRNHDLTETRDAHSPICQWNTGL